MILVDNNRLELDYITISLITIVNNNRLELDYFPFSWEWHEANQHEANQHHLVGGLEHVLCFHNIWEYSSQLTNMLQDG